MLNSPRCCDIRTFLIYIDSYENCNPVGHYYNPCRHEMGYFRSLIQFLERVEECLDIEDMPQAYQSMRTFSKRQNVLGMPDYEEAVPMGKMATFDIRILFRRNSSWQGKLIWLEGGCEQSFRSVLEMIFLMNSALEEPERFSEKMAT